MRKDDEWPLLDDDLSRVCVLLDNLVEWKYEKDKAFMHASYYTKSRAGKTHEECP